MPWLGLLTEARELTEAFRGLRDSIAQEEGMTASRWELLAAATRRATTVSRHARALELTRQSVQRTADRLVEDGHARFEANPDHRRSPLLRVTNQGEEVAKSLDRKLKERFENLESLEGLTEPEEIESAILTLRALREEIVAQR